MARKKGGHELAAAKRRIFVLRFFLEQAHGVSGDGEAAAEVADAFVGGGFKADAIDGKSGGGGEG